jgi:hypothetical protein
MSRVAALLLAMAFGATVVSTGLPGAAQQPEKPFRIGILSPAERTSTKIFDAFREGLRDLGYIDGENIIIEYRLAGGEAGVRGRVAGHSKPLGRRSDMTGASRLRLGEAALSTQFYQQLLKSDAASGSCSVPSGHCRGLCSVRLIFTVGIFQRLRSKWTSPPLNGRP